MKPEWHSVGHILYLCQAEQSTLCIPLIGRIRIVTKNTLNSTLSHTQCVHNVLKYHAIYRFWPYPSMVKNYFKKLKILQSGSRSRFSPKSTNFILVTYPNCPSFVQIHQQLFEILCHTVYRFWPYR